MSATRRFATIRDVASDAQVGTTTVSRAFNNTGYVAADVRQRIFESAERLGYQPSARARSLRSQRTMTLGVVLPELVNPVYLEFLRGVEEVAQRAGYIAVVGSSHHDAETETALLDRMVAERVDGIVVGRIEVGDSVVARIRRQGVAIVPAPGASALRLQRSWEAAESAATEQMARRLVELGHRRIAIVSYAPHTPGGPSRYRRSRVAVITSVLAEVGAEPQHITVPRNADLSEGGASIAAAFAGAASPTAVVASNHVIAPTVLYALRRAGVQVPDDVSFVAYGDSAWASAYRPALSVIRHDTHGEATRLTEMLLDHIARGSTRKTLSYDAEFVERESLAPARDR